MITERVGSYPNQEDHPQHISYVIGYNSQCYGIKRDACEDPPGSPERKAWEQGWDDAWQDEIDCMEE